MVACAAEQVLERRHLGALGMAPLRRLRELLRIAEQHDAASPRRSPRRTSASDFWPASSTNSTSTEFAHAARAPTATRCRRPRRTPSTQLPRPRSLSSVHSTMPSPAALVVLRPSGARAPRRRARRDLHTSSSRLPITAWLCAVMPTRLPSPARGRRSSRAPVVRLARAGRALDGEVRAVERARAVGIAPRAQQQVAARRGTGRARRCRASIDVLGDALRSRARAAPCCRSACRGISARGCAPPSSARAALEVDEPASVVDRTSTSPARSPVAGSMRLSTRP